MSKSGPIVWIGIDPSVMSSGLAFCVEPDFRCAAFNVGVIENIGTCQHLSDIAALSPSKVFITLEYPKGNLHGMPAVRVAANAWQRVIRRYFPRIATVTRVCPQTWQKWAFSAINDATGMTAKEKSIKTCEAAGLSTEDDNVADACNILRYGMKSGELKPH